MKLRSSVVRAVALVATLSASVVARPARAQRLDPAGAHRMDAAESHIASIPASGARYEASASKALQLGSSDSTGSARGTHAMRGAVAGALIGGGIAYAIAQRPGAGDVHSFDTFRFIVFVPVGAGIGALIGFLIP